MKFMVSWSSNTATRHDTYEAFAKMSDADDAADHPGLTLIGRWHDVTAGRGVAICESDDLLAVQSWTYNWNGILNVDITPVLDDSEAKSLVRAKLGI